MAVLGAAGGLVAVLAAAATEGVELGCDDHGYVVSAAGYSQTGLMTSRR